MKRIPNEPTFIFTTRTSIQVWTLADYLRYEAVRQTWGTVLHEKVTVWDCSITAYEEGRTNALIPDLYTVDGNDEIYSEFAEVDGVPFVKMLFDLALQFPGDFDSNDRGTRLMAWVPDLSKEIPTITPWAWTDDGLEITLRLPGDPA